MELTALALRRGGAALVCAVALALALWRWADADPATGKLEGALLDLRFRLRGPLPPPEGIVIVAVDEPALARIGAYEPLRAALAQAVPVIAAAGPRVIALDVILADRTGVDDRLAAVLHEVAKQGAPALLAVAAAPGAAGANGIGPEQEAALARSAIPVVLGAVPPDEVAPALVLPNERLASVALLAHVNVLPGPDGSVRAVPLSVPAGAGRLLPSMALAAARHGLAPGDGSAPGDLVHRRGAGYRIGEVEVPAGPRGLLMLDHYGPAGRIPTVGLLDVLDGRVEPETFAGRIVFAGSTAASLRDAFPTPFDAVVPGVELQATAAANIIEGRSVRRDGAAFGLTVGLTVAGAAASLAAFRMHRLWAAVATGIACWAAGLLALHGSFAWSGLWVDGIAVLGGLAIGTGVGGWSRLGREHRGRENLAHYVAPSLASELAETAHPAFDGREQEVGILFVDVAGYSGMVERERPTEVADFLRELHRLFEDAAERHGGVIVDFQGDGALLVFGLPEPSRGDAANALACAETLLAGRASVQAEFLPGTLRLRVSVHWGPVACAVLGGRRHAQVSITGDAVNVTARLQEFAKAHDATLVATRAALDAAGASRHGLRPLGREALRGRRGEVEVWGRAAGESPAPAA